MFGLIGEILKQVYGWLAGLTAAFYQSFSVDGDEVLIYTIINFLCSGVLLLIGRLINIKDEFDSIGAKINHISSKLILVLEVLLIVRTFLNFEIPSVIKEVIVIVVTIVEALNVLVIAIGAYCYIFFILFDFSFSFKVKLYMPLMLITNFVGTLVLAAHVTGLMEDLYPGLISGALGCFPML